MVKVNTDKSEEIKKKYADDSFAVHYKPFFKAYKNGRFENEVAYGSWDSNRLKVQNWLARHAGSSGIKGCYDPKDGKVLELKTKANFKKVINNSGAKTVCVMFHNSCPNPEKDYDRIK